MVLDWLGQGLVALTLLGCVSLVSVIVGLLYLLGLHLALRRKALVLEAQRLAAPLRPDDALPHLVIQIPVFNEGALVERVIASIARLDWPRDKLHVQVCDDSTDGTTELARAAALRAGATGIDVEVIHRPIRTEFKAGALNNARAQTDHDYFAILDVDYLPPPDFLRRCMAVLLADETLAFVQARIDFLNADENALTRAQTILLDYHLGFEQATRSWAHHMLPFNGTCGIWRRAAIEAAGGWHGHTLLEDWDLSLRAWLTGWRGTYLTAVTAAGELPTDLRTWMLQQRRWATGIGQVVWKSLPAIRGVAYWATLLPFATWLAYAMFSATLIAMAAAMLVRPSSAWALGLTVYAVFASMAVVLFFLMLVANRTVRRATPVGRFILDFPMVLLLCLYVSWASLRSVPATLLGRPRAFVRTPKRGSASAINGSTRRPLEPPSKMLGISIALATFNGEKYLAAQLESLAAQTRLPAELVVSDDGSDDRTVEMLRDFATSAPFPVRIFPNETRLGYRDNFMRAVAQCGSDLIAFCDQDDIWEPEKLALMERLFQDQDVLLAYHNATLIDESGRHIGRLYKGTAASVRYLPLTRHPWLVVPGFTQMFRRDLTRFSFLHAASSDVDWPDETLAHDRWFFFLASVLGHIVFVTQPLARYRQHSEGTFGRYPDLRAHFDRLVRGEHFVRTAAAAARNRSGLLQQMQGLLDDEAQERSRRGIAYYDALAQRLDVRATVYTSPSYWARVKALHGLVWQGAYRKAQGSARFNWGELLIDGYLGVPFGPRSQRLFRRIVARQSRYRSRASGRKD